MAYDVRQRPATYTSVRARQHSRRSLLFIGAFMVVAAIPLVLSQRMEVPIVAIVVILGLATLLYRAAESELDLMGRWVLGNASEQAVGATLDGLGEPYFVMHDIPQDREGNIDHLVSGPNGVYVVETKSRAYKPQDLTKAKRQAAKLAGELDVWVTPVVCLARRDEDPSRHEGGWVMSPHALVSWLREQHNAPVQLERLARFVDTL
jgi:Nuclease-related domain